MAKLLKWQMSQKSQFDSYIYVYALSHWIKEGMHAHTQKLNGKENKVL